MEHLRVCEAIRTTEVLLKRSTTSQLTNVLKTHEASMLPSRLCPAIMIQTKYRIDPLRNSVRQSSQETKIIGKSVVTEVPH